ncbi:MAG: ATP-binding cassette domain-containing protein [Bradymonadales bacterium]|nr:ATP-binding cassette domain-containing protein [Bradymonadales bacterium]
MSRNGFLIRAQGLDIGYDGRPLLRGIDFEIRQGDYIAIIGPNGGGKTTLLKTLLGLLPKVGGQIEMQPIFRRPGSLGYVPQRETFDLLFPLTGFQVALQGRYPLIGVGRPVRRADRQRTAEVLEKMKVAEVAHKPFRDLSGGQKQRVLIARALACDPQLLLLDEPTANMDIQGECEVIATLEQLRKERDITILVVSHFLSNLRGRVETVFICDWERQGFKVTTSDLALDPNAVGRLFSGKTAEMIASKYERQSGTHRTSQVS